MPMLLDNFVGVNGTALAAHSPDVGGPWVSGTAGWVIESNKLTVIANLNPDSHAPLFRRIARASLLFNGHSMNASDHFEISIQDAASSPTNQVQAQVYGTGQVNLNELDAANNDPFAGYQIANIAGENELDLFVGYDVYQLRVNGLLIAQMPRPILKTQSLLFLSLTGTFSNSPYPLLERLSVSDS